MNIDLTNEELYLIKASLQEFDKLGGRNRCVTDLLTKLEQLHLRQETSSTEQISSVCSIDKNNEIQSAWVFLKNLYQWKPGDVIDRQGKDVIKKLDNYFGSDENE